MGIHRQPREVAELSGAVKNNPQRYNKEPVVNKTPLVNIPSHLTDAAKETWFELKSLAIPGVLTKSETVVLELGANLLAEYRMDPYRFPANKLSQLVGILGRLGMTPADRQKLGKPAETPENEFDDFG